MNRQVKRGLGVSAVALTAVATLASPASAAPANKSQVLASWTQTSASSYNAYLSARNNKGAWSAYGFDWSTDYCSYSPDNPFGFKFNLSCARHDFGYRNYKKAGTFSANKARLDNAFYADMKRVCAPLSSANKSACNATAWTYYQAVKAFG
ncbi:phospholipase [Streptomyces apocyni]|uniref:phospholipase n=1 Tax=Streptomyces apocyni TaxID=2654677 RepID=UPI0012EAF247|nr:phospholipase [Streptomyces apocyni]